MRYLLDTCTFLWYSQQPAKLSGAVRSVLNDIASELVVSDVSVWEIVLKHSTGKLPVPKAPCAWIPGKLAYHQVESLALTREAIFRSGDLPSLHADPFDRLLAAQAIESSLTILSPDIPLSLLGAARMW